MTGDAFDEEILETAVARRPVLSALADGPRHRRELQADLDVSKTTCHRIVSTFDEYGLLRRTDDGYELTAKGKLLETYVDEYYRYVRTTLLLEPLVTAFEGSDAEFDVELFADARITRPDPDDPTLPLNSEFELFRDADRFSIVDGNQHVPMLYLEQLFEIGIEKGMTGEHVAPKSVVEKRVTGFPDVHKRHSEVEGKLKYRLCDDVPFGIALYDGEHVVVRAYDDDTGSIAVMADTGDPEAVAWAEDVLNRYREKAEPPLAFDDLPDWTPDADLDV
jgi:hypothetical protein